MKRNFKRTLSLILAVLMVVAVVPFSGMAVECDHDFSGTVIVGEGEHARLCTKCKTVLGYKDAEGNDVVGYQACYSNKVESGCGSRTCDVCKQTFAGGHNFNQKFETEETRVKEAVNCDAYVRYYKSCTCSAVSNKAEDIFVSTTNKGTIHDFTARIMEPEYVAKEKCGEDLYYYFACSRCKVSAEGFEVNPNTYADEETTVQHVYEKLNVEDFATEDAFAEFLKATMKTEKTCTSPAVFYKVCKLCGDYSNANETYTYGATAAHEYIDYFTDGKADEKYLINPATCSIAPMYSMYCKHCGEPAVKGDFDDNNNVITTVDIKNDKGEVVYKQNAFYFGDALNHSELKVTKEAKAATCTAAGNTEEKTCKYCGTVMVESKELPKLGHQLDSTLIQEYIAPTCVQNGQLGKVKCVREGCGTILEVNAKGEFETTKDNLASFDVTKKGHIDENSDLVCDRPECLSMLEPSDTCTCLCHGEGFMYFIGWILKWIWSLMGTNPYCQCGVAHYAVD